VLPVQHPGPVRHHRAEVSARRHPERQVDVRPPVLRVPRRRPGQRRPGDPLVRPGPRDQRVPQPRPLFGREHHATVPGHTGAVPEGANRAVVFDLGGVLIDWNPRYLYRQLFTDHAEMERFLTEVCTDAWHRQHDLGADILESCQRLAAGHPADRAMIMAWAERGEEMAAGQLDGTVEILTSLKAAGVPCYALSNMEPDAFA